MYLVGFRSLTASAINRNFQFTEQMRMFPIVGVKIVEICSNCKSELSTINIHINKCYECNTQLRVNKEFVHSDTDLMWNAMLDALNTLSDSDFEHLNRLRRN